MAEYSREQRNRLSRAVANGETGSRQLKGFVDNRIDNVFNLPKNVAQLKVYGFAFTDNFKKNHLNGEYANRIKPIEVHKSRNNIKFVKENTLLNGPEEYFQSTLNGKGTKNIVNETRKIITSTAEIPFSGHKTSIRRGANIDDATNYTMDPIEKWNIISVGYRTYTKYQDIDKTVYYINHFEGQE